MIQWGAVPHVFPVSMTKALVADPMTFRQHCFAPQVDGRQGGGSIGVAGHAGTLQPQASNWTETSDTSDTYTILDNII